MTPAEEVQAIVEALMSLAKRFVNEIGRDNYKLLMMQLCAIHESASVRALSEREKADRIKAALTHSEVPK